MVSGPISLSISALLITTVLPKREKEQSSSLVHPVFHEQSWHSSVVSSSLASDHRPLCSVIDEGMIWGFYAICSLIAAWPIDLLGYPQRQRSMSVFDDSEITQV